MASPVLGTVVTIVASDASVFVLAVWFLAPHLGIWVASDVWLYTW